MLVVLSIFFAAGSVVMLVRAFNMPRVRVQEALDRIESYYGFEEDGNVGEAPQRQSIVVKLGAKVVGRLGAKTLEEQRRALRSAGMHRVSAEQLIGYRVLAAAGLTLLTLQLGVSSGNPMTAILLIAAGAALGWRLPHLVVERRAASRLAEIDRAMPEFVDLLVVGVESGIGLNGAIQAAATRLRGPLAEELRLMIQEQSLGISLGEALDRVLERADTPALRSFVRAIMQGEKLGTSIANVLRSLATEMRKRRRAMAEEMANKAPVKILFPLVFLIFPSIFIVLMTPAALTITDGLGGGGV